MPSFNLVDEPWIPCLMAETGRTEELGLATTLIRAPAVREIVDPSPLVTVALHRLLLAILHRVFGPKNAGEWAELWSRGAWDSVKLAAYFDRWRHRFDLFDVEHPFYQTPGIELEYAAPVAEMAPQLASSRNAATLFDHTLEAELSPAEAARCLVAFHSFAVGGWWSLRRGEDPKTHKSADAAPLVKGAVALVRGGNLFQTLMLNLHRYDPDQAEPFETREGDCPAWELPEPTRAEDRWPTGYLDLLTWQSRRVRLYPEVDEGGRVVVRHAALMKGWQFPDGFHRHGRETMLAFVANVRSKSNEDPWPPVAFEEDRALWRSSLALVQSVPTQRERPKIFTWLSELADYGALSHSLIVPAEFLGLTTDRAKVVFWRHERLPLPLVYLDKRNNELPNALGRALTLAEDVAVRLSQASRTLARLVVAPSANAPGARQPRDDVVRAMAVRLSPGRLYWSRLDVPFKKLLVDLPDDRSDEGVYGGQRLPEWARLLRRTAMIAFAQSVDGLDISPRTIKAVATAEGELRRGLSETLKGYLRKGGEPTDEPAE